MVNSFSIANDLKLLSDQALNEPTMADPMLVGQEKQRRALARGQASRYAEGGILDLVKPDVIRQLTDPKVMWLAMEEAKKKKAGGLPPASPAPPLFNAPGLNPAPTLRAPMAPPPPPRMSTGGQVDLYQYLRNDRSHLDNLNPEFRARLERLYAAAPPEIRSNLGIKSGYRSEDRQAQLYRDAIAKYGSEAAARKWVAPPGRSNHNHGAALDFAYGNDAAREWAHANAAKYGLNFRMGHEPWHIEMAKEGGAATTPVAAAPSRMENAMNGGQYAFGPTGGQGSAPAASQPTAFDRLTALSNNPLTAPYMQGIWGNRPAPQAAPPPPQPVMQPPAQSQAPDYAAKAQEREKMLMAQRNALLAKYSMG